MNVSVAVFVRVIVGEEVKVFVKVSVGVKVEVDVREAVEARLGEGLVVSGSVALVEKGRVGPAEGTSISAPALISEPIGADGAFPAR